MVNKIIIKGKVALVSGSNRGIGKAITVELLENGAKKVYAGARDISTLDELKEKYGERLVPVELDVTSQDSIIATAKVANDVEILFNNAGVFELGNFLGGNLVESLQKNIDVNVWGVVNLTNALLSTIQKAESGAIVTVSSIAGLANMAMGLTYSASKAMVHSIIQGLRAELKGSRILVCGVYPGPIDTDMIKGFDMKKETPEQVGKEIIAGILTGAEEIFPDPMAKKVGAGYEASPKALEKQFSNF